VRAFRENLVYTRSNGQIVNGTRAPFGNDFGTDVYFDAMGNSVYNSLQVSLKHSGRGLTVLGSYTYGKSIDQASNLGEQVDPYNYGLTRAPSSFDIKNNFVASYRYDLPLKKLFHHLNLQDRDIPEAGSQIQLVRRRSCLDELMPH
jgi:hypothetical protein